MKLPEAFKEQMKRLLGNEYEAYLDSYQQPRALGLRVNTAKVSVADFLKITPFHLKPIPWTDNGFYYPAADEVTRHPHYYAGLYYVQEPSAMIPASRLPVSPGDYLLDLCAAPGGKATELSARLKGSGLLVANDISHSRAKGLLKNLELFGMGNILVTVAEPSRLSEYFPGFFDKILIDAPCSGEGMFRKDPAMVKSWLGKGPQFYAGVQRDILQAAIRMLKPGGMLLYSTCTFAEEENEANIRSLMKLQPELQPAAMPGCDGFAAGNISSSFRIYPHRVRGEGHFVSLLQLGTQAELKNGRPSDKASKGTPQSGTARSLKHPSTRPAGMITETLESFLNRLSGFDWEPERVEIRDDHVYLMPEGLPGIRGLRFLRTGLLLGTVKRNRFEPSQALAMHLNMNQAPVHLSLPADDPRVWRYLKGETLELTKAEQTGKSGWILFGTDGYPLGWAKLVNGTLRNKYCPGWRMR